MHNSSKTLKNGYYIVTVCIFRPIICTIPLGNKKGTLFSARQHIGQYAIARYMLSTVRPSVTRVDQSKTVEVRITQPSPQSSPTTLVF